MTLGDFYTCNDDIDMIEQVTVHEEPSSYRMKKQCPLSFSEASKMLSREVDFFCYDQKTGWHVLLK